MDVLSCFLAVDKGGNVRVVEALEDRDLRGQVVFEFLVELAHIDRLDCHEGLDALQVLYHVG